MGVTFYRLLQYYYIYFIHTYIVNAKNNLLSSLIEYYLFIITNTKVKGRTFDLNR